jgi:hypothetical protein
MTTEYLRGEVLYLLDWAQQEEPACCGTDARWRTLRHEAESVRIDDLSWVVGRALAVAESGCWQALISDDAAAFRDRARLAAALYDFGVCSNLLPSHSIWRKGQRR